MLRLIGWPYAGLGSIGEQVRYLKERLSETAKVSSHFYQGMLPVGTSK